MGMSMAALARSRSVTLWRMMTVLPFISSTSSPSSTPKGKLRVRVGLGLLLTVSPASLSTSRPPTLLSWA